MSLCHSLTAHRGHSLQVPGRLYPIKIEWCPPMDAEGRPIERAPNSALFGSGGVGAAGAAGASGSAKGQNKGLPKGGGGGGCGGRLFPFSSPFSQSLGLALTVILQATF